VREALEGHRVAIADQPGHRVVEREKTGHSYCALYEHLLTVRTIPVITAEVQAAVRACRRGLPRGDRPLRRWLTRRPCPQR
jgi:hypothetical protein